MVRQFSRVVLFAGLGLAAAACQDSGMATAPGYYQPPPPRYATPYGNAGYYAPPPGYYRQQAPAYYYGGQPATPSWYNQSDGRRYTTVIVTNRGQNGYRDDVVRQQVVCGSQYYDGYRTQTAPSC